MNRIEEYLDEGGVSPFGGWFDGLDSQAAAIVTVALGHLGDGNTSNAKAVAEGMSELRENT